MNRRVEFYRHSLGARELASLETTVNSLFISTGPRVAEFEAAFAEQVGAAHAVGVSSCSTGLVLALRALDVGPGDEVITTPMTFLSTSSAVQHVGGTLVLADIDPASGLVDPASVAAAITPRTRAILAVHLYGQLADMVRLRALADQHGVALVEDAAPALVSRRGGARPGSHGDLAVFSFNALKEMTSGEGGAVVTDDPTLAARVRALRKHGIQVGTFADHGESYRHYEMRELGYKAALTDVQAALLLPQIGELQRRRDQRAARVERYTAALRSVPGVQLIEWVGEPSYTNFVVLVPAAHRDAVLGGLEARGVGCRVHYRATHIHPYYRDVLHFEREDYPLAAEFGDRVISLPLWPDLPLADVDYAAESLAAVLEATVS